MSLFYSSPSSALMRIEKRYSKAAETEEMIARYGGNRANIDRLRQIFFADAAVARMNWDLICGWTGW